MDGCEKKVLALGWCEMHYRRNYRHGDVHTVYRGGGGGTPKNRKCEVPDCEKKHYAHGLCSMHNMRCYVRDVPSSVEAVREHELAQAREIFERWEATR